MQPRLRVQPPGLGLPVQPRLEPAHHGAAPGAGALPHAGPLAIIGAATHLMGSWMDEETCRALDTAFKAADAALAWTGGAGSESQFLATLLRRLNGCWAATTSDPGMVLGQILALTENAARAAAAGEDGSGDIMQAARMMADLLWTLAEMGLTAHLGGGTGLPPGQT